MLNLAFIGYSLRRFCLAAIIWTPVMGLSLQWVAAMGSFVLGPN